MIATLDGLRLYLGTLAATLWNYGAAFPTPALDRYDTGEYGFNVTAELPGPQRPRPAEISLAEIWSPADGGRLVRVEYAYDFIEHPLNRRRAFHGHDPARFAAAFHVLVHEHCEERLGQPVCDHYYGPPVDGYEAIRRFTSLWGQPAPLGCADLRCIS